jgi:hypothetical protein
MSTVWSDKGAQFVMPAEAGIQAGLGKNWIP